MATEKLLKALVSGPAELLDEAIHKLILDREFHPLSAATLGGRRGLLRPGGAGAPLPYIGPGQPRQ